MEEAPEAGDEEVKQATAEEVEKGRLERAFRFTCGSHIHFRKTFTTCSCAAERASRARG
jgi:hypothetical protein